MQNTPTVEDDSILNIQEHFNIPQLTLYALNPFMAISEWARGTGKSTGAVAIRAAHCAKVMPRSAGTFCAPSWRKFVDHMWPGIRKGFNEKMKMKEGRDYMFLQSPPDHWRLPNGDKARPYMAPGGYQHFISFRNGSGFHIISFDYKQTANALDTDWNVTDEAKLLNGEQVQEEVFNTLRGNNDYFGHRPEHKSRWLFSDKYVRSNSRQTRWLQEFKGQASSPDKIAEVVCYLLAIQNESNPLVRANLTEKLWQLQKKLVYYSQASSVDNIHALGLDFIINQSKSLTSYGLLTSIFNEDVMKGDGEMFYALFSEALHSYEASDNSRVSLLIERNGFDDYHTNRDCRLDTDIVKNKRLKLLLDFGGNTNWVVTCQKQFNVIRALKNFWVEKPKKFPDLIQTWCDYYDKHGDKTVELYYDVSGNKEDSRSPITDAQEVITILRKNGWSVIDKLEDCKKYVPHRVKYRFWEKVLDMNENRDERFPKFAYNASNCFELAWSMSHAEMMNTTIESKKFQKNKKSETDTTLPQWQATHLSDCVDWLAVDYLEELLTDDKGYGVAMH